MVIFVKHIREAKSAKVVYTNFVIHAHTHACAPAALCHPIAGVFRVPHHINIPHQSSDLHRSALFLSPSFPPSISLCFSCLNYTTAVHQAVIYKAQNTVIKCCFYSTSQIIQPYSAALYRPLYSVCGRTSQNNPVTLILVLVFKGSRFTVLSPDWPDFCVALVIFFPVMRKCFQPW